MPRSSRRRDRRGVCFLTVVFLRALPDDRPRTAALYGALAISERSLRSICTQMAELYVENKKCARLLRDLAEMGHVPAELVRPAPRPPVPPSAFRGRRDAVAVGAVFFFLRRSMSDGRDKSVTVFIFLSRACAAAPPRHRRDVAPVVSSDRWLLSPCTVALLSPRGDGRKRDRLTRKFPDPPR